MIEEDLGQLYAKALTQRLEESNANMRRGIALMYLHNPTPARERLEGFKAGMRRSKYRPVR